MARFLPSLLMASLLLVVGCQATSPAMVDALPSPNFNGPIITGPAVAAVPAPRYVPPAPQAAPQGLAGERAWAPSAPARRWKWIVVHHSATPAGSAAVFHKMHRDKGWDELGYHFVIGNGTDSSNGQVEVGPRWPKQKWGAHAKTPDNRYNDYGIGICLVGNFDIERPTPQQMQSLARLTAYLMKTYGIPSGSIVGHRDTKPTECPGRNLNIAAVRRMATQILADAGEAMPEDAQTANARELLDE